MEPYIFDLEAPVSSLETVPADLHSFFEKRDDGFVVADTFKPTARRMNGLAENLTAERSKRTVAGQDAGKAREMVKAFQSVFEGVEGIEEVNPENVKKYFDDLRTRAAKGGKAGEEAQQQLDAVKQQMASAHARELETVRGTIAQKDAQIEGLVVGSQITDAIAKHEIVGGEVFRSFLQNRIKVQTGEDGIPRAIVVGEDGKTPVYSGTGDPMTVDEYVSSLRSKEEYAPFFKSKKVPGEGTAPHGQRHQQGPQGEERTAAQKISAGLSKLHNGRR